MKYIIYSYSYYEVYHLWYSLKTEVDIQQNDLVKVMKITLLIQIINVNYRIPEVRRLSGLSKSYSPKKTTNIKKASSNLFFDAESGS